MRKYIDFAIDQTDSIRFEVEVQTGGVTRGDAKAIVETASLAFDQALTKLKPMCATIVRQLRDAVDQPDEISVEFGVKLSTEAGVIIASTAGEANLNIKLTWKQRVGVSL